MALFHVLPCNKSFFGLSLTSFVFVLEFLINTPIGRKTLKLTATEPWTFVPVRHASVWTSDLAMNSLHSPRCP